MTHAQPASIPQPALPRGGEQLVETLRDLEDHRICGLVSDDEYTRQRTTKLRAIVRPNPMTWLAALLGLPLIGGPAAALTWFVTHDDHITFSMAVLAGAWGILSVGRMLHEKCAELMSRGRRKILVALLDNDLLTGAEFAEHEEQLLRGS
jgi:hypothetical protein